MASQKITSISLVTIALLLALYGVFLSHKINLVTADLGRHIKNGELLVGTGHIVKTNFYSYTEPELPVLNHHWGSGALFFGVWKLSGFVGLQLFFIALSLLTFLIFFRIAWNATGIGVASIISLLVIPLIAERTEIRPEAFSYLFAGVFLFLLLKWKEGTLSFRKLAVTLAIIEVLWVNMHIYFFLGPAIVGAFLAGSLVTSHERKEWLSKILLLLGMVSLASLLNPFGLAGALAPLTIFERYGYRVAENQSVWFMERYWGHAGFFLFKSVVGFLALGFFARAWFRKWKPDIGADFFLAAGFSAMAMLQTRNMALFGFFALPLIARSVGAALREKTSLVDAALRNVTLAAIALFFLLAYVSPLLEQFPYWHEFGWGLETNNDAGAEFFKKERLRGPIFNNYDIGGYLIFHLFGKEKVFVDNRPEAYSTEFFIQTYIPAQERDEVWQALDEKYRFNAIFFSYRDMTPWAQQFLAKRLEDSVWAPVFADQQTVIFLKRSAENQSIIARYEIRKK